jgi:penicillin amidase
VPNAKGRVKLRAVRAEVEILRDRWGVPHIYAGNLHDLFFAMGYAQAQDRLWQMEFNRRLASGTLAEVLGEGALEVDRLIRRIGFRRVAEADWPEAEVTEKAVLEAFSAGVNAYIERAAAGRVRAAALPPALAAGGTMSFGRYMAWTLSGNWDVEIPARGR